MTRPEDETARPSVSDLVRAKALQLGDVGVAWLAGLPSLINELEQTWSITVGESFGYGTASYVAHAHRADGTRAVLKLIVPDPHAGDQIATLVAANGHGYVRVLAHDIGRAAVLMERLGPPLNRSGLTPTAQIDIVCQLLRGVWRRRPPDSLIERPGRDAAAELAQMVVRLSSNLDAACPPRVIDRALAYAGSRSSASNPGGWVLVHGDAAPANVLAVTPPRADADIGFVFVDPTPFFGDPAYDLGVLMRDWSAELGPDPVAAMRRLCQHASARTGIGADAIWEWGYLERVTTGLYLRSLGNPVLAQRFLDTADRLLD